MARKPLIAGNWKMNLTHLEAIGVTQKLAFALPGKYYDKVDVAVLPPFTDLRSVQTLVDADSMPITYGGQDLSPEDSGAFTGDVSGVMLAKLGCTWVVVGHSERRTIHGEDDALVNRKVHAALRHGLTPILCLGEGEEVRDEGNHVPHCTGQLDGALKGLAADDVAKIVIAYEPVWAIGTGKTAGVADAQEVCHALRERLREVHGGDVADGVRILYGGSVKANNVADLVRSDDIDGALVGGASLDPEGFAELCALAAGGPLP
ncbi:triose-phosphate isomerase [Actinomycetospora sp. C-140]